MPSLWVNQKNKKNLTYTGKAILILNNAMVSKTYSKKIQEFHFFLSWVYLIDQVSWSVSKVEEKG